MFVKSAIAALAAVALVSVAHAAPAGDQVSVKVSMSGLDMKSESGAKVLLQRIQTGSKQACGDRPDMLALDQHATYEACVKSTIDRTVGSLDNPLVTSLNGGPAPKDTTLASAGR